MARGRPQLLETVEEVLRSWGLSLTSAPRRQKKEVLKAFLPFEDGKTVLVGTLCQDADEFVYHYSDEYRALKSAQPIPGFGDLDEEYRSSRLFPFFQARLPPLGRPDIAEILERKGVEKDDTLRVLSAVSSRAIASPYIFKLGSH